MDVALDEAGNGEPAIHIVYPSIGDNPGLDRHDYATFDGNVDQRCRNVVV